MDVLIIEDNDYERELYVRILASEGHKVVQAGSIKKAREILNSGLIFVAVVDVNLPDGNGIDFILEIKTLNPNALPILFTSKGAIGDGVQAMKNGAFDYIVKGESPQKLLQVVNNAVSKSKKKCDDTLNVGHIADLKGFDTLIGESEGLKKIKSLGLKVADTQANVLVLGETGVGKDVFAEALHHSSSRRKMNFVAINCSSFGQEMLESELFGYKAGAFTGAVKDKKGLFEEADKGTIFLDEIGEMGIHLQSRILRVLENKCFIKLGDTKVTKTDCRLIAATHVDLAKAVSLGKFREDLYYRISGFVINIPALRDRHGDIKLLANHYITKLSSQLGIPRPKVTGAFFNALEKHKWKGNVRELINVIQRSLILCDGILDTDVLDLPKDKNIVREGTLTDVEAAHIKDILQICGGNKRKASRKLGISIATLYRRLDLKGEKNDIYADI